MRSTHEFAELAPCRESLPSAAFGVPRYPTVLVIGAMKSATTTLAGALASQPGWDLGRKKEPDIFNTAISPARRSIRLRLNYRSSSAVRVDATTEYSKPGRSAQTAELVHRLSPKSRIVFVARHPVDRTISHLLHDSKRTLPQNVDLNRVVFDDPRYIDTSRYRQLLQPWERLFNENLTLVSFEQATGSLSELSAALPGLIGSTLSSEQVPALNAGRQTGDLRTVRRVRSHIPLYEEWRGLLPQQLRSAAVRRMTASEASAHGEHLGLILPETREKLHKLLEDEVSWYTGTFELERR